MCNPLAATRAGGMLLLALFFIFLCQPLHADTSRRACTIDDSSSGKEQHFAADCFYDDSGRLIHWIFSVRPLVVPECTTWDEKPGRRKHVPAVHEYAGGPVIMSAYESCEEIPETDPALLPPPATAITGFPAVWKTQREYSASSYWSVILDNWTKRQEEIEESWRHRVEQRTSSEQAFPKLQPNRTSPFLPVFHRPADNFRGMSYYLPQGAIERACQQAEAPGCDYVDPGVRRWKYEGCRSAGVGGCEYWLNAGNFSLEEVIQSQFSSWVIREALEDGDDFPPRHIYRFPGELNFKTLRVPLYNATRWLVWYWNQFWQRCWAATPEGKRFDGCAAELRDYVQGSAHEKAEAKSYPNAGLKIEAVLIARAIDSTRSFHEATRELIPLVDPNRWQTGVDGSHFEPDELKPETVERIRAAQQVLTQDLAVAQAALRNFAVDKSFPDPEKEEPK
jgi:hypothetical protein